MQQHKMAEVRHEMEESRTSEYSNYSKQRIAEPGVERELQEKYKHLLGGVSLGGTQKFRDSQRLQQTFNSIKGLLNPEEHNELSLLIQIIKTKEAEEPQL